MQRPPSARGRGAPLPAPMPPMPAPMPLAPMPLVQYGGYPGIPGTPSRPLPSGVGGGGPGGPGVAPGGGGLGGTRPQSSAMGGGSVGFLPRGMTGDPGARQQTGLLGGGTANLYAFNAGQGGALNRQVNVAANPIGREGLVSVNHRASSGRQVQDASYYIAEIRSRISVISDEVTNLQGRIEKLQADRASFSQLNRIQNQVREEIQKYEGLLADYNLCIEKKDTELDELDAEYNELRKLNDRQRKEADRIFSQRQQVDNECAQLGQQIRKVEDEFDYKLKEKFPDRRAEYYALRRDLTHFEDEIGRRDRDFQEMQRQLRDCSGRFESDYVLQRLLQMEFQRSTLLRKVNELRACEEGFETNSATNAVANSIAQSGSASSSANPNSGAANSGGPGNPGSSAGSGSFAMAGGPTTNNQGVAGQPSGGMNAAAEKEELLGEVKRNNATIEQMQSEIEQMREEIAQMQDETRQEMMTQKTTESVITPEEEEEARKLEELRKKDEEMQKYIDSVPQMQRELEDRIRNCEGKILQMLEGLSVDRDKSKLPSAEKFEEMKADLEFKEKQMEYSAMTLEKLQEETQARRTELEKIEALDAKISAELQQIQVKMGGMNSDLENWKDINEYKKKSKSLIDDLNRKQQTLLSRRDNMKQRVQMLSARVERERSELAKNDTFAALEGQLQQIRFYEQNNFTLREYIASKGAETNYRTLASEVEKMTGELNNLVIAQMNTK